MQPSPPGGRAALFPGRWLSKFVGRLVAGIGHLTEAEIWLRPVLAGVAVPIGHALSFLFAVTRRRVDGGTDGSTACPSLTSMSGARPAQIVETT